MCIVHGENVSRDAVMPVTGIRGSWVSAVMGAARGSSLRGWRMLAGVESESAPAQATIWCGSCFHEVERRLGGDFQAVPAARLCSPRTCRSACPFALPGGRLCRCSLPLQVKSVLSFPLHPLEMCSFFRSVYSRGVTLGL